MHRVLLVAICLLASLPAIAAGHPPALLGVWGGSGDGAGQFIHPTGLALDAGDNLFIADLVNHRIQVLSSSGAYQRQWGSYGFDASSITGPMGLAVDTQGRVFIAEWTINDPQSQTGLQVFQDDGAYLGSWGSNGCAAEAGQFCGPVGVAVGPDGRVYVTDTGLQRIQVFTGGGVFATQWSVNGGDVAVDGSNNVYVATGGGVRKFSSTGDVLGSWGSAGTGPGQFNSPFGVAVDVSGHVYVADTFNNRVQVFTSGGAFLVEWGAYGSAPGQFDRPMGIAVGHDGRIFVADTYNDRIQVFGSLTTPARPTTWGQLKTLYR
jgi:tripartite motif-containing protein 71